MGKSAMAVTTEAIMQQIDRLMAAEIPEEIDRECKRSTSLSSMSSELLGQSRLMLDVIKTRDSLNDDVCIAATARMLGAGSDD